MKEGDPIKRLVNAVLAQVDTSVEPLLQLSNGSCLSDILSSIRQGYFVRTKRILSAQSVPFNAGKNGKIDQLHATHTEEARLFFEALSLLTRQTVSSGVVDIVAPGDISQTSEKTLLFMKVVTLILHAYLDSVVAGGSHPEEVVRPVLSYVTTIVKVLHDSLLSLQIFGIENFSGGFDGAESHDFDPRLKRHLESRSINCRYKSVLLAVSSNHFLGVQGADTICPSLTFDIQLEIVNLCEFYWFSNFTDRHIVTPLLVPLVLRKSMEDSATKADLKRLWMLRDSMRCLDFNSKSFNHGNQALIPAALQKLLPRIVSSPLYCKTIDGRKIIAFAFTVHKSIAINLHQAIKAQISYISHNDKAELEAYGDVYLRAWKFSLSIDDDDSRSVSTIMGAQMVGPDESLMKSGKIEPLVRVFIEDEILSDVVYSSLHVASPTLAKKLRLLLGPFFAIKKDIHLEGLFYRLYGPLLWRSLSAANPIVRHHATFALVVTFPLHDPESSSKKSIRSDRQDVVKKTTHYLQQLLTDSYPKVRIAAADATARILSLFWDAIPSYQIRSLLQLIITQHANDLSSGNVRSNAVHAITLLLKATDASHAVLRMLLPSLGNLIHDKIERVRVKTIHLLLTIKTLKDIKFYHVVPSDHLLARLAIDGIRSMPVSRILTKLLLNSYFPQGAKGSEQMERTLLFLSRSPDAARVFYANLKHFYPVNVVCKLIAMLIKVLKLAVDRHKDEIALVGKESIELCNISTVSPTLSVSEMQSATKFGTYSSSNASDPTNESVRNLTATNTSLMASVAETVEILFNSIDSLPTSCEEFIKSFVADVDLGALAEYFEKMAVEYDQAKFYADEVSNCKRITMAILNFARRISQEHATGISTRLLSLLSFSHGLNEKSLSSYIFLSVSCDKIIEMTQLFSRSIIRGVISYECFGWKCDTVSDDGRDEFIIPIELALDALSDILRASNTNMVEVREKLLSNHETRTIIEEAFSMLYQESFVQSLKLMNRENYRIVLKLHEINLRYCMHKSFVDGCHSAFLDELLKICQVLSCDLMEILSGLSQHAGRPSSPFHVLNVSNISFSADVSERISLSPTSTFSNSLKRKRSTFEHNISQQANGFAFFISLGHLVLCSLSEYMAIGGDVNDEILYQYESFFQSIVSLKTDEHIWPTIAKGSLGSIFDRVCERCHMAVA